MLDLKLIRDQPDETAARLATKVGPVDLQPLLDLDAERRRLIGEVEELRQVRKRASKDIGRRRAAGEDMEALQAEVRGIGDRIQNLEDGLREVEADLQDRLLGLPNLPHPDVPRGAGPEDNRLVRTVGEPRTFAFTPRPHWDLGTRLGILDFERAARVSGSGFPVFVGAGARLVRGLIQFMLDLHTTRHGYTEVAPPVLLTSDAMTGTGQLPKMEDDMYRIERDGLYLAPTAEVPVTNLYREEIIADPLPICLTAYTPCFRREAGSAGKDTRGLIRLHQFDKVELVKFVAPETSYAELESLRANAEAVLEALGLTYRVLELCTGDLSFAAAKCYDLELWAPGCEAWLEVSSCSNFEDFQARRAGIRYRGEGGKPRFVHTLNGSGVALPRLIIALLENGQQEDGSVVLPEALHPYLGGLTVIQPS